MKKPINCFIGASLIAGLFSYSEAQATIINAASCSQADVSSAILSASNGDTVNIPNGSCSWTSGISTSKEIVIRAQNYTPTDQGTMTRNVTITNNSSSPLFSMTSGNSFHVQISGIRFNEGSGIGNHLRFQGSGTKPPLLNDCAFEVKQRNGTSYDVAVVTWQSLGGVEWNSYYNGLASGASDGIGPNGASRVINSPRGWDTASTMGMADVGGLFNTYLEDSTAVNVGQFPDVDHHGRAVVRYNTFDGTIYGQTHGFTSGTLQGRHVEVYNNTFSVTNPNRNHSGRYYWIRAGTFVFTENVVNNAIPQEYGDISQVIIGDTTGLGPYPVPRQPGFGHNGTTNVSDPIYIWNQTGTRAYSFGFYGGWDANVVQGRDIFVNKGAKPGYAKFTYPHPLRTSGGGVGGDTLAPAAPLNVRVN